MCYGAGKWASDGITPKLAVIMIGTNNHGGNTAEEIADGVKAIVAKLCAPSGNENFVAGHLSRTDVSEENQAKLKHATGCSLQSRKTPWSVSG